MSSEVLQLLAELFRSMAQAVAIIVFMVLVAERLVEFLKPICDPGLAWLQATLHLPDGWIKMIFSWLVVAVIVAATELNIFATFIPKPWAGRILTVIFCGGGSNMLHDVWPQPRVKGNA